MPENATQASDLSRFFASLLFLYETDSGWGFVTETSEICTETPGSV
jgi:hypothetical protein